MFRSAPKPIPEVDPHEAAAKVEAGALLIDVREANEYQYAHIPNGQLKPMSTINDWYADLPKDQTIVFYCRTGRRSDQVVRALIEQAGFTDVWNLIGGIVKWTEEDLPVETPPAP